MFEQKSAGQETTRRETGVLIFRNHCYALRCSDGAEYWLELDASPCHLIDQHVKVEGEFYPPNILSVYRVRPV